MFLIYVVTKHLFCFAFLKFIIFSTNNNNTNNKKDFSR